MKRIKKASELFHEVDPGLNVIDRGRGRGARRLTGAEWDRAGGAICPRCGQGAMRFVRGVCLQCAQALNEKLDRDEKKRARELKFIKQHNVRIDKRKRAT